MPLSCSLLSSSALSCRDPTPFFHHHHHHHHHHHRLLLLLLLLLLKESSLLIVLTCPLPHLSPHSLCFLLLPSCSLPLSFSFFLHFFKISNHLLLFPPGFLSHRLSCFSVSLSFLSLLFASTPPPFLSLAIASYSPPLPLSVPAPLTLDIGVTRGS